jgi:hypothetical protein
MTGAGPIITEMTPKGDKTGGYPGGFGYIPGDIPGTDAGFILACPILMDAEMHRD